MSASAVIEPLIIVALLLGGTWLNRNKEFSAVPIDPRQSLEDSLGDRGSTAATRPKNRLSSITLSQSSQKTPFDERRILWQNRRISILGWSIRIRSPDTQVFAQNLASRILCRFPYLIEVWYWALIYWVGFNPLSACQATLIMMIDK